ncbi:MAG: flagellar type III secretion system pore protein FliP [Candidatus Pelethousia sp.]|nr:flagellar type III secretion system pore protein FliP [Candidatus Pelethousia sp.]
MRLKDNLPASFIRPGPIARNVAKRHVGRGRAAFLLLALLVALIFVMTGCVSEEEIQAALANQNTTQENAEAAEAAQPLEPMEEEAAETETPGMLSQLVSMLGSRSQSVQIVGLLTILSLAPSILIMLTSFVRVIMVLSFTRNALGLQQMPPNQVLVGLALFLTLFIMGPVVDEIKTEAYIPYIAEQITLEEAVDRGAVPVRGFMLRQTRSADLAMFCSFAGEEPPATEEETRKVPMRTLIPAFLTSELKRSFEIGFFIYIPFIVIDMIVASTLMAMGMMMLPPIVISLPFKVLLFVVVDGWTLTMQTLVSGFL